MHLRRGDLLEQKPWLLCLQEEVVITFFMLASIHVSMNIDSRALVACQTDPDYETKILMCSMRLGVVVPVGLFQFSELFSYL